MRRLPKTLTGDEPARLLAAIFKPHHRLIALMGLYLGLRISEILTRRVEDIDFERGMCRVWQGKGKKDRTVPIPARLLPELRAWCEGQEGWLFPSDCPLGSGHLGPRAVQQMIKAAALRAGIARKVTPHVWRHTCATQLLRSGADIVEVRDILGHSTVAITQVYLSSDPVRLKSVMDRLDHGGGAIPAEAPVPAPICAIDLPPGGVQPMPTEPDSVPAMLRQVVAMLTDQKREVNRPTCSPELDTVQQAYEAHQWALEQYPALARARDVDVYNFIRSRTDCPFRVAPSIHTHRRHLSAARLYRHGSYRKRVLPTSPRHEASPAAGQEGGAS